jgi:phage baseplate assembly protein V
VSRELFKALAPLARRIRLMAGRAILTLVNDATKLQGVQVKLLDGEVCDNVDRVQHYGFTSVPLPGAEGIYLALGGSRDNGVIIADDDRRYRIKGLQGGEVAIYTDEGDSIILKRGHVIEVATQTLNVNAATVVNITTPTVNMSGDLNVAGDIVAQGDISDHGNKSMAGMRQTYNAHTHSDPQGGSVSLPTGQM